MLLFQIIVSSNGVSIGLSLVVFIGIVLAHVYVLVRKKYTCRKNNGHQEDYTDQEPLLQESSNDDEMYSPARVINRRESLIFDFEPTH